MANKKRVVWIVVAILACAAIGLGIYFYIQPSKEAVPVKMPIVKEAPPRPPEKAIQEEEKKISPAELPKLEQSDDWLREKARDLSSNLKFADWFKIKNIIRRIAAAVDNIAEGNSPRAPLDFLKPKKGFTVKKKGERLYVNPKSYTRYNLVADIFSSLDAEGAARVFKELKPLFQEAYRELGYPDRDFQDTLIRAIKELLRTPAVEGDILLEEKVISSSMISMADEKLEDLSDAQKHLIRMGPKNTAKIQGKLREIAGALGIPENQLPKSRVYFSKVN